MKLVLPAPDCVLIETAGCWGRYTFDYSSWISYFRTRTTMGRGEVCRFITWARSWNWYKLAWNYQLIVQYADSGLNSMQYPRHWPHKYLMVCFCLCVFAFGFANIYKYSCWGRVSLPVLLTYRTPYFTNIYNQQLRSQIGRQSKHNCLLLWRRSCIWRRLPCCT